MPLLFLLSVPQLLTAFAYETGNIIKMTSAAFLMTYIWTTRTELVPKRHKIIKNSGFQSRKIWWRESANVWTVLLILQKKYLDLFFCLCYFYCLRVGQVQLEKGDVTHVQQSRFNNIWIEICPVNEIRLNHANTVQTKQVSCVFEC